jgi:hypothetical protein
MEKEAQTCHFMLNEKVTQKGVKLHWRYNVKCRMSMNGESCIKGELGTNEGRFVPFISIASQSCPHT